MRELIPSLRVPTVLVRFCECKTNQRGEAFKRGILICFTSVLDVNVNCMVKLIPKVATNRSNRGIFLIMITDGTVGGISAFAVMEALRRLASADQPKHIIHEDSSPAEADIPSPP